MKYERNTILDFVCRGCGLCCKEEGYVFFSDDDILRASSHLNMSPISFVNKYLKYSDNLSYYAEVTETKPCIFLENNLCIIHKAKPVQCSTFPYWSDYTNSKGEVLARKFNRPCPGVKPKK